MQNPNHSKGVLIVSGVIAFPFIIAVTLLINGLFSLVNISLEPGFNFNLPTVILFSALHIALIVIFMKWNRVSINQLVNPKRRIGGIIFLLILVFISSFLLVMGGRMNLNYWLRSDTKEIMLITVSDKRISQGKSTDYFVDFETPDGDMNYRVTKNYFNNFNIGDSYKVEVKKGYFEGNFLEKIKEQTTSNSR